MLVVVFGVLMFSAGVFVGILGMFGRFMCGEILIDRETHDRDIYRLCMYKIPEKGVGYSLFKNTETKVEDGVTIPQDFQDS